MSLVSGKNNGYIKSLNFLSGIFSGFFILMLLCSLFNSLLFRVFPSIKPYISIAGSVYMLYLAYKIMISIFRDTGLYNLFTFKKGFFLQFVNVKVILYGLVLYGTFISPYFHGIIVLILTALIFAFTSFISISLWALTGSKLSKIINKNQGIFNFIAAGLMVFSSVSIIFPVIKEFF